MLFWILQNTGPPGSAASQASPEAAVNDIQDVDLNTALIATGTLCLVSKVVKFNHELSVGKP
ncbi:hypothetical protein C4K22_1093 [Pseudomonas chlororaphis subsp. aurantiaca]|jgi:hypothetical protein|uniref:hypothetical protein n=1 Tax=Pseudomonas chlororaphis TaxID=587753 RepID=UPI0009C193D1|nr:hypothetical protein [Pseudomonas chlororaphis]AZD33855.1 hypothetical protein C4K22_1093 [Pseudomonas chlororaphis subsp. aurantiaca]AZD40189.1 hypothetical protein C4K21_1096 [Pseudomonas chlororaphis subsp. aurantiaca]AZD52961.1 hypothetical protein C4K19_1155 [Pseudomonas chlororaphis subsp. aurantiaca]AZD59059.1 hypothetical protein C4K18_1067 [Pseudomonas chlororaphis subsp. aurantiaca]AZD64982.1 hypothetical protein C4K17_1077 [Pseudomonas chlororaphis subsp. aurantiaca]